MEKIEIHKKEVSWLGLSLILFFILWMLPWRFQVNDDVIMMWLVSGAYTGMEENYVVFLHPVLSWALSQLYKAWSFTFSWYSLLWFLCIYYSFFLIYLRIRTAAIPSEWRATLILLVLAVSIHLCFFPQFTLVSGFLALATWIYGFQQNPTRKFLPKLLFLVGIILSILIRAEAFLLVSLGILFFFFALDLRFRDFKYLFIQAFLIFLVLSFSKHHFEQNSQYTDFLEFNKLRHQVIDHPVFYEKAAADEFLEDEKWGYFSNWYFQESAVDLEDLRAKKAELDQEYFSLTYLSKSMGRYWQMQTAELFKGFISLVLILLFLALFRSNKKLQFLLLWFVLFFIANHIFHLRGRVAFLFFLVLLFPVLQGNFQFKYWQIPKSLTLLILLVLVIHFSNVWSEAGKRKEYLSEFNELIKATEKDELLMLEGLPLEYFSQEYSKNQTVPFFMHGWISRSPFQEKALQRFGLSSLSEVEKFDLIVVKAKAPFLTQDFMNSISPTFFLESSTETEHLILYKYLKD